MLTKRTRQLLAALLAILPPALAADTAALRQLLEQQRYRQLRPLMQPLLTEVRPDVETRWLIHDWLWASEDIARLEERIADRPQEALEQLSAGRLTLERKQFEAARLRFEQARDGAGMPALRSRALQGLAALAYQQRDYAGSLAWLEQARREAPVTADLLMALNETLIRLGRTNAAVEAAEQAFALNPDHEQANYQLGNGYTRRNYRELAQACGETAFSAAAAHTRKASDAYEAQALDTARDAARQALRDCPGYGRAHAVLAKVAESERLRVSIHRETDEARFAATPMPEIPGIERYVLNWTELSPRHQKRVALSVAPWKAFVPVLVAGGASHFIKPLWMRLSETPGGRPLRDARIAYDSRLWDDVRGMGGHDTVTGIEDVERSIFQRYNTVLHELTHQVHGVLTQEQNREIEALYRQAKERDAEGELKGQAFLSRYAGGSVWEYFAEGANSEDSPRRDANDFREIVRERLLAKDPALRALVQRLFAERDLSASLPQALVKGAFKEIAAGRLPEAMERLDEAGRLAPQDPQVLRARLQALALRGEAKAIAPLAELALSLHPDNAPLRIAAVEARWHSGTPLAVQLPALLKGRERLSEQDRFELDLAAGRYAVHQGDAKPALAAYEAALAVQADSPEALWGRAAALALAGRADEAFAVYERVLKLRTGVQALRLEYARELLLAGRLDAARAQLGEARTLNAAEPELLALQAWLALRDGDAPLALRLAEQALAGAAWCDSALLMKAAALRGLQREPEAKALLAALDARLLPEATPRYVYRSETSEWESVNLASAGWRRLRAAVLN